MRLVSKNEEKQKEEKRFFTSEMGNRYVIATLIENLWIKLNIPRLLFSNLLRKRLFIAVKNPKKKIEFLQKYPKIYFFAYYKVYKM